MDLEERSACLGGIILAAHTVLSSTDYILYHLLYVYKNTLSSRFLNSRYACPRQWMRGFHAAYNEFKEKKKPPPPVLHPHSVPLFPLLHTTSHFLIFFSIVQLLIPLILLRNNRDPCDSLRGLASATVEG